jgi:hypothetical protein
MPKPGPKSANSLAVVPAALPQRPEPPDDLPSPEHAEQWREIVAAMPAGWFTSETWPVLRQLCQHIVTSKFVAMELSQFEGGLVNDPKQAIAFERLAQRQEKEGDAIVRLSQKLRLTKKSRYDGHNDRGSTAIANAGAGHKPWD